ncbi:MAG: hypothetical protein FJW56_05860 [Actinobacteria bacterium]|nr:hypothetical protein [Actinomycetota bacterium]
MYKLIFLSITISSKVVLWQLVLGVGQAIGKYFWGMKGLIITALIILLWTLSQTYNELFYFHLIIQSIIFIVLLNKNIFKKNKAS